jgi:carbon starvation protein
MLLILFPLVSVIVLVLAYRFYGRLLTRWFGLSDKNQVPSEYRKDGVDFVPSPTLLTMGHHFSSIAGAGPIVGPILAAIWFGWGPAVLWILLGSIFIGGVHDFGSLISSLRHKAASIPDLAKLYMGKFAWVLFLIVVWLGLEYVIVVFLDLTAVTFTSNGAVANSSVMFIGLALVLGFFLRGGKFNLLLVTIPFVILLFLTIWLGDFLAAKGFVPTDSKATWNWVLLIYCLIASVTPVWLLLQPRDYLSSFLLYVAVIAGAVGLLLMSVGGATVQWPMLVTPNMAAELDQPWMGPLFPILFITIACGACSGFHSIVASGTTARQVKCESDSRRVGYGAMLIEGFVAVLSLCTVLILPFSMESMGQSGNPLQVYSNGVGTFLSQFGVSQELGATFALLAVSTFLLTTLDTCTRLTRFITQELFGLDNKKLLNRIISTVAVLVPPGILVFMKVTNAEGIEIPMWRAIWPVFGATNQFLGAMALLAVTVWMKRSGRKYLFAAIPMVFMLAVTMSALFVLFTDPEQSALVVWIAIVLFILGFFIIGMAALALIQPALNHEKIIPVSEPSEPTATAGGPEPEASGGGR